MERFYLEEANINRKDEAIEYILEHKNVNSKISGVSRLDEEYMEYENWLKKLELFQDSKTCPSGICPGRQYFLIRESDNKLIGMIHLRWNLNEWMHKYGGHIGYGIRPTERKKGYNKINLYLCLIKASEIGLNKVLLTVVDTNKGSIKTIEALGGILENKIPFYKDENVLLRRYWIDIEEAINKYREQYSMYISDNE